MQQEIENEEGFLLWCGYVAEEREVMERYLNELVEARVSGQIFSCK